MKSRKRCKNRFPLTFLFAISLGLILQASHHCCPREKSCACWAESLHFLIPQNIIRPHENDGLQFLKKWQDRKYNSETIFFFSATASFLLEISLATTAAATTTSSNWQTHKMTVNLSWCYLSVALTEPISNIEPGAMWQLAHFPFLCI